METETSNERVFCFIRRCPLNVAVIHSTATKQPAQLVLCVFPHSSVFVVYARLFNFIFVKPRTSIISAALVVCNYQRPDKAKHADVIKKKVVVSILYSEDLCLSVLLHWSGLACYHSTRMWRTSSSGDARIIR